MGPGNDTTTAGPAGDRLVGADRVLAVLKELGRHPAGTTLDDLTRAIGSPKPTVHRALQALVRAGLADREGRLYVVGDELIGLAFACHEARPDQRRIGPILEDLAGHFGETAHYAVLDGHHIVYRAKVDPPAGAVRLTSTIGGRNPAHATAVGKLLLAEQLPTRAAVAAWCGDRRLERRTANTRTTVEELHRELELTRSRGYGLDDQENEVGVNCIAVPAYLAGSAAPSGAVSVSALTYRTPLSVLVGAAEEIRGRLKHLGAAA